MRAGDLVASVKVAPHARRRGRRSTRGEAIARTARPLVWVAPFRPTRVGVLVKESVHGPARERFEASVRPKIEGLGSTIVGIDYVDDDAEAVEAAMAASLRRAGASTSS